MEKDRYIVGLDESGTGALAHCATTCAFAVKEILEPGLLELGINDSKKLSDAARRRLCIELATYPSAVASISIIAAEKLVRQREAWREAMAQAFKAVVLVLGQQQYRVIVDGNVDEILKQYFARVWGIKAEFYPEADAKYCCVAAASILAKTERNDHMLDLHQLYPQYGFANHMGYGTAEHMSAIATHGICVAHRRVKPLLAYFGDQ